MQIKLELALLAIIFLLDRRVLTAIIPMMTDLDVCVVKIN